VVKYHQIPTSGVGGVAFRRNSDGRTGATLNAHRHIMAEA